MSAAVTGVTFSNLKFPCIWDFFAELLLFTCLRSNISNPRMLKQKAINHRQCWQSNDNWKGWTCGFYSIYSCKIIQIQHLQKWPGTFLPKLWLAKTNNWQFYSWNPFLHAWRLFSQKCYRIEFVLNLLFYLKEV